MTSFVNPAILFRLVKYCNGMTSAQFKEQFAIGNFILSSAYCRVHNKRCRAKRACCHAAGPPCIDWSSQWRGHTQQLGSSFLPTIAWIAQRLTLLEEFIVHGNIAAFPAALLEDLMGVACAVFPPWCALGGWGGPPFELAGFSYLLEKTH